MNAPVVHNTANYFDLLDFTNKLLDPYIAAQIAQSTAWRIDTMIQQAARQIFRTAREVAREVPTNMTLDTAAELNSALAKAEFAELAFEAAGSNVAGPVETIHTLMFFREAAHQQAAELTSLTLDWQGRPRLYEIPDIDDVFHAPVDLKLTADRRALISRRMSMIGKANDMADSEIAVARDTMLLREEERAKDQSLAMQDAAPAVHELFRIAMQRSTGNEPGAEMPFYTLDINLQRALIANAIQAAKRGQDFASKDSNMTDGDFMSIIGCVSKAVKELTAVLNTPRFRATEPA